MLVVHGIWAYGAAHLWAEDSALPAAAPPRPGRPSRAPRPHPFARDAAGLAAALAELPEPAGDLAVKAVDDELTLWLPSAPDGPLASPELIRAPGQDGAGRSGGRAPLRPWRVPALVFEPAAAADLLAAVGEGGPPSGQAVPGGTLHYLAAAARLAADLAARGRLLPALRAEDGGYAVGQLSGQASAVGQLSGQASAAGQLSGQASAVGQFSGQAYVARWRPVLAGADAERARELAAGMPPLCRATESGGRPSAAVLAELLDTLADAAARAWLGPLPLLPARRGRRPSRIPVAERWVHALTAADPAVEVSTEQDETEAAALAAELATWHSAAQLPAGPVRTCFRLIEPAAEAGAEADADVGTGDAEAGAPDAATGDDWRVEFALQSTEDPSLVTPASDVWAGLSTAGLAAGIKHPEEELLTGLGRAARLFPELDQALRDPAPAAVSLDTEGAFGFLKQAAPLLSGAGFGVLLPDWVRRARLGLKLTTRTQASAGTGSVTDPRFGLQDLVNFRYDLAIGDQELDPAELEELARLKVPLVRLRGQWVELDDKHLKAALKFLERGRSGTMSAGDALLAGLHGPGQHGPGQPGADGDPESADLPLVGVDADGWLGDLLSGHADRHLEPVPTPAGFHGELRPYQERGLAWMSFLGSLGLGGVLADSMGLGKTPQLLSVLAHEHRPGVSVLDEPTLVICPMSVVGNWEQEAARFTPGLRVHVHHGAGRLSGDELAGALAGADLVITTYGVAARDRAALAKVTWARVVCDEAQNIKNHATRQAQAVRSLPAGSRIALTGTPVENRLADLWSIMEFSNPGLLGPAEKFRQRFAVPIERNADDEAAERLRRITGPFILRRLKTDKSIISDLPDKLEMKVWCNLTAEQASLYQATVTDMMARIEAAEEGIERRGLVLATMAKLKQVCNHPAHLLGDGSRLPGRSGKLARLEEICDEIVAEGDKALAFTQYAEFGAMLQPHLAARLGRPVLYLHGGTPKKRRDAMVSEFQQMTEPAVFLLSLKAGGTGLNLTAASHVIHVDRWWNPAVEDQATDRAFRIGQRKDVQVRKFVCVGTLEERIDTMIEEKKALAERIVGTGESWLTELSVAELRKVIALSPEAVSE
jgi:SNF2 family DNA or RNA helicase